NDGEWEPNEFGGNGNLEAIAFLKDMNDMVYRDFQGVQTIAEEATNWPGVSRPTYEGGLGFGMKWMMGWMHDTLRYFKQDPLYRKHQQDQLTFSMVYYYDENFMLPLSHDEVVHGKSPMIFKMPGDEWQKFANLRLLYTYMFTHPGAKLLFMGNEFGQTDEWDYRTALRWDLLQYDCHAGLKLCVRDLTHLLTSETALHQQQFSFEGFYWHDLDHREESIVAFKRIGKRKDDEIIVLLNMTPVERSAWVVNVDENTSWREIFNSDAKAYWGTGHFINDAVLSSKKGVNSNLDSIELCLPPLGAVLLKKVSA
ncbi:MAG: alpha amylase C-terminal domain-containing protein, partial [bacterium]